ncbi:hypothetical protein [Streptomyces sp. NBC_01304]|uniref:hypothetical protein n=1 Tax=Streptomyces sp. NBC_01304 TaxID=2903818 RepID=UPI002E12CD49|nr:hypothetical protein OG430_26225 [Streptomyces sp. NBC_01304]
MSAPPLRRPFGVPALLSLLLAVLAVGLFCGPATASSAAADVRVASAGPTLEVKAGGVGCGKDKQDERGSQPAAPSRGGSVQEALGALAAAHACGSGSGDFSAEAAFAAVDPDRGPPPGDPPSPVALSVLRV